MDMSNRTINLTVYGRSDDDMPTLYWPKNFCSSIKKSVNATKTFAASFVRNRLEKLTNSDEK